MSGGLDSSTLAALASRRFPDPAGHVAAHTIVVEGPEPDAEPQFVDQIARHLGIPVHYRLKGAAFYDSQWQARDLACPEPNCQQFSHHEAVQYYGIVAEGTRVAYWGEGPDNALVFEWRPHLRHLARRAAGCGHSGTWGSTCGTAGASQCGGRARRPGPGRSTGGRPPRLVSAWMRPRRRAGLRTATAMAGYLRTLRQRAPDEAAGLRGTDQPHLPEHVRAVRPRLAQVPVGVQAPVPGCARPAIHAHACRRCPGAVTSSSCATRRSRCCRPRAWRARKPLSTGNRGCGRLRASPNRIPEPRTA